MPELDIPEDFDPPSAAPTINIPEDLYAYSTKMLPTVTPNPNEDPHRALKKVIRLLEASRAEVSTMIGAKSLQASDPRVRTLLDLGQAQGLVEGYMLGEQWKQKFYGDR